MIQTSRNEGVPKDEVAQMDYGFSASEFERMIKNKASSEKRYGEMQKKRMALHEKGLVKQLGPIVGSQGNRNVNFAGWDSTHPSALAYLEETGDGNPVPEQ